jgi:hypothetical protein
MCVFFTFLHDDPLCFHQLEHEIVYLEGDKLRECGLPLSKLEAWKAYEENMVRNFVCHRLALDETNLTDA